MAFAGCENEKDSNTQAYITLGEEELLVSSFGSTVSVSVQSNYDWECSYSSDWFKAETNKGSLGITYDTNETGADRKGVVTITAGDGGKNVAEAELKITQSSENFDALILEYTITANDTKIQLPIRNVTNATIDWGDGETETTSTNYRSHTYSIPGIYIVKINGVVTRLCTRSFYTTTPEQYWYSVTIDGIANLSNIIQWGNTGLTNIEYAFYKCSNLSSIPEDLGSFSNVKYLKGAFYSCSSLKEIPEGIFDYCSNATDFSEVFYGCSSLTTAPDFSNCTKVTDFSYAFRNCSSLATIPENIFSNCTEVTDFSCAFYNCSSLTAIPENIFSNCTEVTDFSYAFCNCSSLTAIPENIFSNCTAVTDFSHTFSGCSSLTAIPENILSNCPAVTDFSHAFYNCSSLTAIPANIFSSRTEVTSFSHVFYGCSTLTSVPENTFSGCSSVTDFSYAFYGCSGLTSVPENVFSGCSSVGDLSYAFYGCSALTTVPTCIFDDTKPVKNFDYTFYNCSSVVGESPYTEVDVNGETVKTHLYERENYAVDMHWAIPENYKYCFRNSTFSDIDSIPSSWK